jgi:hypothetical protein
MHASYVRYIGILYDCDPGLNLYKYYVRNVRLHFQPCMHAMLYVRYVYVSGPVGRPEQLDPFLFLHDLPLDLANPVGFGTGGTYVGAVQCIILSPSSSNVK